MRKTLLALYVMCSLPLVVKAEHPVVPGADQDDMCGLGWQVTNKRTFIATTTRGTTNGVVPPTFGMTSGTIGCDQHKFAKNEAPAVKYTVANHDVLAMELASGHGEYVEGLAQVMGCNSTEAFAAKAKENFSQIVTTEGNGVNMYQNIRRLIQQDASLSCGIV